MVNIRYVFLKKEFTDSFRLSADHPSEIWPSGDWIGKHPTATDVSFIWTPTQKFTVQHSNHYAIEDPKI